MTSHLAAGKSKEPPFLKAVTSPEIREWKLVMPRLICSYTFTNHTYYSTSWTAVSKMVGKVKPKPNEIFPAAESSAILSHHKWCIKSCVTLLKMWIPNPKHLDSERDHDLYAQACPLHPQSAEPIAVGPIDHTY